jgi:DNA-binding CsgD family transcriptional regulator
VFVSGHQSAVRELHAEGLGAAEIAHRLGVALSTVHYHLRCLADSAQPQPTRKAVPREPVGTTRTVIGALLARGLSRAEIARRLGVTKSTVTYHARRLGEPIDARCAKRIDWEAVQAYYDAGHSVRECLRVFGFSSWSWHSAVQRGAVTPRPGFRPLEEVFAAGTRRNRGHLKARLLLAGIKQPRCEICGLAEWRSLPLTVELHHVNGERNDNRIENLQLLCPNCHSQTQNYAGRRRATTE